MESTSGELRNDAELDIMNDPAFGTGRKVKPQGVQDQDTCRICRGEGSNEEPLFYPCKCSGSIKFVHQACLMEWLSHSQKKHCELCKTSFRFTKLYHPQMPRTVPLSICLRQAALHTLKNVLTWARWNLVVFVWLGWFPWLIRLVWRCLFWLGDGGWVTQQELEKYSLPLQVFAADQNTTSPTRMDESQIINVSRIFARLSFTKHTWTPLHKAFNLTFRETTMSRLAKKLYDSLVLPSVSVKISSVGLSNAKVSKASIRAPSIFSDVTFLRNLTRWELLNNFFIDILEGQLITVLIVAAFILIFLIREWVVQQQPALNMGPVPPAEVEADVREVNDDDQRAAADNEADINGIDVGSDDEAVLRNDDLPYSIEQDQRIEPRRQETNDKNDDRGRVDSTSTGHLSLGSSRQSSKRRYRAHSNSSDLRRESDISRGFNEGTQSDGLNAGDLDSEAGSSSMPQRPRPPTREAIAKVNEIQRGLEEQSHTTGQDWPGIEVFMDFWKRSDSDPDEVLQLIENEGRTAELRWIVAAMHRLKNSPRPSENLLSGIQGLEQFVQNERSDGRSAALPDTPPLGSRSGVCLLPNSLNSSDQDSDRFKSESPSQDAATPSGEERSSKTDSLIQQETLTVSCASNPSESRGSGDSSTNVLTPEEGSSAPLTSDSFGDYSEVMEPLQASLDSEEAERPSSDHPLEVQDTSENQLRVRPTRWSLLEAILNWLWGGLPDIEDAHEDQQDDEQGAQDIAEGEPFIPAVPNQPVIEENNAVGEMQGDANAAGAAAEAERDANDAEPMDDGEDLEGVMELIGMQGPLAGLIQNGMFSAVLISLSVFIGIWIPYVAGKFLLVSLTNPITVFIKLPLRWISSITDILIDLTVFLTTIIIYWIDLLVRLLFRPVFVLFPFLSKLQDNRIIPLFAYQYSLGATSRLTKAISAMADHFSDSDVPVFSIIAHESLKKLQRYLTGTAIAIYQYVHDSADSSADKAPEVDRWLYFYDLVLSRFRVLPWLLWDSGKKVISSLPSVLSGSSLKISLETPPRTEPLDISLAEWNIADRVITICLGYVLFYMVGALFLNIRSSVRDARGEERDAGLFAEVVHQAGGVTKVILIIGIEMIIFPLYCGILLDIALLPLFENTTLSSRLRFTITSPTTSLFIHWFIGTCYMFHFALFVSMCRKIMRTGVLYFIRDPDDPAFHPVRDVLERNVYTQLRKIAFSALVYGALVIVCLGSVVWSIWAVCPGVFPIHWSSSEPVLEFPVDLLFYNFLMPVGVKIFKPSAGLNLVYEWWFRKCARLLRLTHFLFGERRQDEEGHLVDESEQLLSCGSQEAEGLETSSSRRPFVRDGRLVRAPASDQVRIPKGSSTFVEVNEDGYRADGQPDSEHGLHGRKNTMFAEVYIPPRFRLRIAAFVALLWLFAAVTGISTTIVPLLVGRFVFSQFMLSGLRMNDMYAFAIGLYLLGGPIYFFVRYRAEILEWFRGYRSTRTRPSSAITPLLENSLRIIFRAARLGYFYGVLALILPSLVALMFEAYVFIPLHTHLWRNQQSMPPHTIHFMSDWTLGILYIRVCGRMILNHQNSRPARALRALVSSRNNGASWLDPDIRLATRALILPAVVISLLALLTPIGLGYLANITWFVDAPDESKALVYRYSFPAILFLQLGILCIRMFWDAINLWRARVRDEVYLIGERLHNFGDKRPAIRRMITRTKS